MRLPRLTPRTVLLAIPLAAVLLIPVGTAGADHEKDPFGRFGPPPQLRTSLDWKANGKRASAALLGEWCWSQPRGQSPRCTHFDYARCPPPEDRIGPPAPPPPPPCGPAFVRPGYALALDTRWAAKGIRVVMRPPSLKPGHGRRLRVYRSGTHRFLVRIPRRFARNVLTIDVRYARGLKANWSIPIDVKN